MANNKMVTDVIRERAETEMLNPEPLPILCRHIRNKH